METHAARIQRILSATRLRMPLLRRVTMLGAPSVLLPAA